MFEVLDGVCKPTKNGEYSAAIDLYSREDIDISVERTAVVALGIKIDKSKLILVAKKDIENSPKKYKSVEDWVSRHYLQLEPTVSIREKGLISGIRSINLDYQEEITIIFHSVDFNYHISKGDKVAQIILQEHKTNLLQVC